MISNISKLSLDIKQQGNPHTPAAILTIMTVLTVMTVMTIMTVGVGGGLSNNNADFTRPRRSHGRRFSINRVDFSNTEPYH